MQNLKDMNTNVKIALGFLIGTAAGTIAGLLLAPSTGKTARKNINKKAKKLVKKLEGFVGKEKKKSSNATTQSVRNGRAPIAST
jgi:gas vesicle protein